MTDPTPVQLPPITGGDELYDSIMSQIEPDLVTAMIPLLEEKYKSETPEQNKMRMERYQKAFEKYKEEFAKYSQNWDSQLNAFQRSTMQDVENDDRKDEGGDLSGIESAIANI